jgi:hypothetical protein
MESYGQSSPKDERVDYEYTAHVRAWETFANLVRGYGISLTEGDRQVTFRSGKRIDMRRMKEKGLLWSYTVAKIIVAREVVEKG